ncbi:MAG: DUF998 domain-containing protein [Herpetosiphonaceae bacterium]|nr:DUF998 domain-containing protein [Herpetosiphonaceae bacterium]
MKNRGAAWAGIVGPALFVLVFMIEGRLRPNYSPISTFVSELSLGPRGWVQIANFMITGGLLLVFARGVAAQFREGKASKAGPLLLTIIACCLLISGPLVTEPSTAAPVTLHGILHGIFGAVVFSLAPISCFVFFRRFRDDPTWHPLHWWTLAAGVIIVVAVVLMKAGQLSTSGLHAWLGLIQRVALITYMAWIATFALRLLTRTNVTAVRSRPSQEQVPPHAV